VGRIACMFMVMTGKERRKRILVKDLDELFRELGQLLFLRAS
jgi:hypothetical protein